MESRYHLLYVVDMRINIMAIFFLFSFFVFVSRPLERGVGGQYFRLSAMFTDNTPSDRVEAIGILEQIWHLDCRIPVLISVSW